jgi:hypothetical protein
MPDEPRRTNEVPQLQELLIDVYVRRLEDIGYSLRALPEIVVGRILFLIVARGELTFAKAELFKECGHTEVVKWIDEHIDLAAGIGGAGANPDDACRPR